MAEHESLSESASALGKAVSAAQEYSRKPWVCVLAAAIGILIGIKDKHLAESMAPAGHLYMTLLSLTVAPIIFSALTSGISRLVASADGRRYAGRIAATLLCGTFAASLLGVLAGSIAFPMLTNEENRDFIGQVLAKFDDASAGAGEKTGFWGFVANFVPSNVLDALSSDNLLAIVFIAGLLGMAICHVAPEKRELALNLVDTIYETFLTILEWVLYFLPPGLCCLMASQVAEVGLETIKAMLIIIALYLLCFVVMAVAYLRIITKASGKSLKEVWGILKGTFTLAFVASSDSAIPLAIKSMGEFKYPKDMLRSVIPLSAAMNRHGTAIIFALTTLFIADIYDVNFTALQCVFVALLCAIVGAFDSGEYVTIAPMIAYVLAPLGLPPAAGIAIILTIWPMIEWLPELQCIMAACANAAVAANLKTSDERTKS